MKRKFLLLGVFLLTALLTLPGSPSFAQKYSSFRAAMVELRGNTIHYDDRFCVYYGEYVHVREWKDNPTIKVARGGGVHFCFLVRRIISMWGPDPTHAFEPRFKTYETDPNKLAYLKLTDQYAQYNDFSYFSNQSRRVGNTILATQLSDIRDTDITDSFVIAGTYDRKNLIDIDITVSENAPVGATYQCEVVGKKIFFTSYLLIPFPNSSLIKIIFRK